MANTGMLTGNALTVKLWALQGFIDMYKKTVFGRLVRRGTIMRAEELDRAQAGDSVTFAFTGILSGIGLGEGGTLSGNEESLNNQSFSMVWNVFRHAVASPNDDTIEQQRTRIRFEQTARTQLEQFHCSRLDASCLNQLAGTLASSITVDGTTYSTTANLPFVSGLNTMNAATTNRIIWQGGYSADESITSADTITLDLVDAAVEKLASTYPNVKPLDNEEFDLYISYEQWTDLKRDASGKIQWYTNQLAAMTGGEIDNNAIRSASHFSYEPVGKYGRVNIILAARVANGYNSSTLASISTVKRAILCGSNALAFASKFSGALEDVAETGGSVPLVYKTQLKDYDYIKGVEARMLYGVKKVQFNNEDFGSIVLSTYAASHTS